ncbi:MAG TPA: cytochrome-c peroxidase, partial [Flavobacteriaceae bacterium]|nr:cytochrome-c peroxidase [Flavobacteriaceae bacterium]
MKHWTVSYIFITLLICASCSNENVDEYVNIPTPAPLDIPQFFQESILPPLIPVDNPQTVEGVALGKKLFFDPILSANNTQACADCHSPQNSFSDPDKFSDGIDGLLGNRNS